MSETKTENKNPFEVFLGKIPSFTFDEVKIGLVETTSGFKQLLEIIGENAEKVAGSPKAVSLAQEQISHFNELFEALNARLDELKAEATKS
jgi:ubiquinone biosynthesis protein UbiJ